MLDKTKRQYRRCNSNSNVRADITRANLTFYSAECYEKRHTRAQGQKHAQADSLAVRRESSSRKLYDTRPPSFHTSKPACLPTPQTGEPQYLFTS